MSKKVTFSVPGRPVGKQRKVSRDGWTYMPDKTTDYMDRIAWFCRHARPDDWPIDAYYQLKFVAIYPSHNVADGDNIEKTVKDALECDPKNVENGTPKLLWKNDCRVRKEAHDVLTDPDVKRGGLLKVEVLVLSKSDCEV